MTAEVVAVGSGPPPRSCSLHMYGLASLVSQVRRPSIYYIFGLPEVLLDNWSDVRHLLLDEAAK